MRHGQAKIGIMAGNTLGYQSGQMGLSVEQMSKGYGGSNPSPSTNNAD